MWESVRKTLQTLRKLRGCLIIGALITAVNVAVHHTALFSMPARQSSPAQLLSRRGSEQTDKQPNIQARGQGSATPITRHNESLTSDVWRGSRAALPTPEEMPGATLQGFAPRLTGRDLSVLQEIVVAFSTAMKDSALTFFLYSGSLLGSWRHHGLVPWDDDVDMAVPARQALSAYRALGRLKPQFWLDVRQKKRWKLYSMRSHPIRLATWCWPFVDVSFYDENETHVWDRDANYPSFTFPFHDVFPLRERPFMGMMLPAPRDSQAVLGRTYNLTLCKAGRYDHRTESIRSGDSDQMSVPCAQLQQIFPFVWRQAAGGGHVGCNESLVSNGSLVDWIVVDTPAC